MGLKIVYRVLHKFSHWAMDGYYSEIHVEGKENVPSTGPIILVSTHHNEILDIATLAMTMPHRRHISFWAKSTMFRNPLIGAMLSSSGAIPVKRNPNNAGNGTNSDPNGNSKGGAGSGVSASTSSRVVTQESLFRTTSKALSSGEVVGVFPEGTSYTEPGIVQMLPGAAWAAVEYVKWIWKGGKRQGKELAEKSQEDYSGSSNDKAYIGVKPQLDDVDLIMVPVGVVYTDKSRYRSQVCVTYGKPIRVREYVDELWASLLTSEEQLGSSAQDLAARNAVGEIMNELEIRIKGLTVNAADWDTLHAAQTARDILWSGERELELKNWVATSQILVDLFSGVPSNGPNDAEQHYNQVIHTKHELLNRAKSALIKYRALLHYANIDHKVLCSLLLPPAATADPTICMPPKFSPVFTLSTLSTLPLSILNLLLFIPPFLFHIPAYFSGRLLERLLAQKGEEEGTAQYRAIGGGLGLGAETGILVALGLKSRAGRKALEWLGGVMNSEAKWMNVSLLVYVGTWILTRWHNAFVSGVYYRYQQLITSYKLRTTRFNSTTGDLTPEQVAQYRNPPLPPVNPFIKMSKEKQQAENNAPATNGSRTDIPAIPTSSNPEGVHNTPNAQRKSVPSSKLTKPLLEARVEAYLYLTELLIQPELQRLVWYLEARGGRVPVSTPTQ